ncbi:MAG: hypothetical protein KY432_01190 [Acidobacteria bacterium]|nr:hypothetical protein [Acidobacteriota bacterium]
MKRTAYGIFEIAEVASSGANTSHSRNEILSAVELTCTICGLHWVA